MYYNYSSEQDRIVKKRTFIAFLLCLLIFTGTLAGQDRSIAVINLEYSEVAPSTALIITSLLVSRLEATGAFSLKDEEGVDFLLKGKVSAAGTTYIIKTYIEDSESEEQWAAYTIEVEDLKDLDSACLKIARELVTQIYPDFTFPAEFSTVGEEEWLEKLDEAAIAARRKEEVKEEARELIQEDPEFKDEVLEGEAEEKFEELLAEDPEAVEKIIEEATGEKVDITPDPEWVAKQRGEEYIPEDLSVFRFRQIAMLTSLGLYQLGGILNSLGQVMMLGTIEARAEYENAGPESADWRYRVYKGNHNSYLGYTLGGYGSWLAASTTILLAQNKVNDYAFQLSGPGKIILAEAITAHVLGNLFAYHGNLKDAEALFLKWQYLNAGAEAAEVYEDYQSVHRQYLDNFNMGAALWAIGGALSIVSPLAEGPESPVINGKRDRALITWGTILMTLGNIAQNPSLSLKASAEYEKFEYLNATSDFEEKYKRYRESYILHQIVNIGVHTLVIGGAGCIIAAVLLPDERTYPGNKEDSAVSFTLEPELDRVNLSVNVRI